MRWHLTVLKRPCRVRSSNARHCLFTGIADASRAQQIAADDPSPRPLFRLGRADLGGGRSEIQSFVLSQRIGLAARQRPDRLGPGSIRRYQRRPPGCLPAFRSRTVLRSEPNARAVLRLRAPQRRRPDPVPRGLFATSLVGCVRLSPCAGQPGAQDRRNCRTRDFRPALLCRRHCPSCASSTSR